MCGIAGIVQQDDETTASWLRTMLDAMRHRGPDGAGVAVGRKVRKATTLEEIDSTELKGNVGLGHVRLAIVGGPEGFQPLRSRDGRIVLLHNGEIYNHHELRAELGGDFETKTDSEVILRMLERAYYGDLVDAVRQVLEKLDGVYAIAASDGEHLVIARDPLGVRQLYLSRTNGTCVFASEKKALIAVSAGRRVERLRPAHLAVVDEQGWRQECFRAMRLRAIRHDLNDAADALAAYRAALDTAVFKRIRDRDRVGVIFSGGVDSVVIAQLLRRGKIPFRCYTAGFEGAPDLEAAKSIARRLDFPLQYKALTAEDIETLVPEIMAVVEDRNELDSGLSNNCNPQFEATQPIRCLPYDVINDTEKRMAIVVPCKQERLKVLEGVLCGIPHDCLAILVSNSSREPVDRFNMEREALLQFCHLVQRPAVLVHQRDPGVGTAFCEAGYSDILDQDGLVRNGKAEGMIIGLMIAKLCGKDYIGFIDADNYVPGAVHEYAKEYAAGFHLAQTPYAMTRISWHSKPKIQGSRLFFNRWGRCSENTNYYLNQLMSHYSGFGTEIIKTGNAGEHALSMALAEKLKLASGYAVEPYEYIHLLELFGGVHASPFPEVMKKRIEIFQIETRNPHFHEDKGDDHVVDMQNVALNVLYHSTICPDPLKEEIRDFLRDNDGLDQYGEPEPVRIYPPLHTSDQEAFLRTLAESGETFEQIEHVLPRTVQVKSPIDIPDFPDVDGVSGASMPMAKAVEESLVESNG